MQIAPEASPDETMSEVQPVPRTARMPDSDGQVTIEQQTETEQSPTAAPGAGLTWLTVERMLYAVLLLVGGGIRFFALSAQPLTTSEATGAWMAWLAVTGQAGVESPAALLSVATPPTSPLLYTLHSLLFWVAGGGDALARFAPALLGTALILLPWWMRGFVGRGVALFVALLFAIDPWLVAYSRLADGAMLSIVLGLLTLTGLMHVRDAAVGLHDTSTETVPARRWLVITAISSGLLLVSGVQAWNFLPVLVLYWALSARTASGAPTAGDGNDRSETAQTGDDEARRETGDGAQWSAEWSAGSHSGAVRVANLPRFDGTSVALFLGAALLGATGWLARPEGLGYISTSLTAWVRQFTAGADTPYSLAWVVLRLVTDQPLLTLFGPVGLVFLWRVRRHAPSSFAVQWPLFLTAWTAWGVLLLLAPGRNPYSLAMLGLPLLLAAAHAGDVLVQRVRHSDIRRELGVVLLALSVLAISGLFWLTALISRPQFDANLGRVSLAIGVLAIAMIVFFGLWVNWRDAVLVTGLFVGGGLLLATFSSSWQLNHRHGPLRPDAFFAEYTDPDVRNLARNVQTLSAQRAGDPSELPLVIEIRGAPDPLLGWYLRPMRRVTWSPAAAVDAATAPDALLISSPQSLDASQLSASYMGSDYSLRRRWLPTQLVREMPDSAADQPLVDRLRTRWTVQIQPLARWMAYRSVGQLPPAEGVVLWAPPG